MKLFDGLKNALRRRREMVADNVEVKGMPLDRKGVAGEDVRRASENNGGRIEPEDLYILHLSDLHINNGLILHAHQSLIDDVRKELGKVKRLVVVVSGDIVEQCDYSQKNVDSVCDFFRRLKASFPLDCELLSVEVVPGNHEVELPVKSNEFNEGEYRARYGKYEKLRAGVLDAFGLQDYANHNCVTQIPYHDRTVCFVRVDTSWTKNEREIEADIKKDLEKNPTLKLGQADLELAKQKILESNKICVNAQTRQVSSSFRKAESTCEIGGKPIACTIAVSHFPITWLLSTPYEKIRDFLFNHGLSDVNIWLCGHAHQAQLYFNNDDAKSTLMLMTGVGRGTFSKALHRYSIYRLNLERNTIDVKIRSIGMGVSDQFGNDTELFGRLRDGYEYYPFPLVYNQAGAFHKLSSPGGSTSESILLDRDTVDVFREVSLRMGILFAKMQMIVNDALSDFEEAINKKFPKLRAYTHKHLKAENVTEMADGDADHWSDDALEVIRESRIVERLLVQMASEVEEVFTQIQTETGLQASESYVSSSAFKGIDWRVHFRRYEGAGAAGYSADNDLYSAISLSSGRKPKTVPFQGTIEAAFNAEEYLVVKSVSGVENPVETDWSDFLTGVPDFPDNNVDFKQGMEIKRRPLLTYGISVRYKTHDSCRCASRILCGMDFAMLNRCVSYALFDFNRRIKCNFEKMITQMKDNRTA